RDWLMQKSEQPSSEAKLQRAFSSLSLGAAAAAAAAAGFSSGGLWPNSRPEVAIRQSQALVAAFPAGCTNTSTAGGGKARPQKHRAETSESAKTAGGDDGGVSTTRSQRLHLLQLVVARLPGRILRWQ
uniref:Kinesin motor domain-containing protein n=1 Tax=Macrostomum lignano TaxID=282301 RepID=A0A1I8FPM7_9PLAT